MQPKNIKSALVVIAAVVAGLAAGGQAAAASNYKPRLGGKQALSELLEGNQRYSQGNPTHPNQSTQRRTDLAAGQHPIAAVLGCSDSRVPPELVFDQGLGDLFVVRLAGNVADHVAMESLDYSVKHLGVRLILVLGHDKCGAVTAAVAGHEEPGEVGPLLTELRPAVVAAKKMPGNTLNNAIRENVILTVEKLEKSRPLRAMVNSGELKIAGGIYHLDTGKVEMLQTAAPAPASSGHPKEAARPD